MGTWKEDLKRQDIAISRRVQMLLADYPGGYPYRVTQMAEDIACKRSCLYVALSDLRKAGVIESSTLGYRLVSAR